jgi:FtsH-binding integral membrane protein
VNASLIFTAFMVTCIVFASFTLAALYAPDTKFLHLGGASSPRDSPAIPGILISTLSVLLIATIFSRSAIVHWAVLWIGLAVSCGLVLYDTQLIVEKRRRGDTDYIWHTVDLFVDFMAIFRRILIILADKEVSAITIQTKRTFHLLAGQKEESQLSHRVCTA